MVCSSYNISCFARLGQNIAILCILNIIVLEAIWDIANLTSLDYIYLYNTLFIFQL
jgi:hypothetical protein